MIEVRDSINNLLLTPRLMVFNLCTQAGLSRCKHWLSLLMPSSASTPMCLRHLFKSSHHPTCSGIATQLMCHPSKFWPQSLNLTHPESASGKPSPKCAYIRPREIGYHHPAIPAKETVWTKWCGKWWTEWEERSWFSNKTLSLGQVHRKILCSPSAVQSCPLLPVHVSFALKR